MTRIAQLAIQRVKEHVVGESRTTILSARAAAVDAPPAFPAERIRQLRKRMGLSQTLVAAVLGVDTDMVRAWEQRRREPSASTARLLEITEERPEILLRKVHARQYART
jgi:DNA-binding transcriptional regulator YiaG